MTAIDSLRIGTVPFANVMPLDFYLPEILPNAEFVYGVPSKLAPMLEEGTVDVALLSTIELFGHPEYGRIPDIGICSDGQVGSVCLFTQEEPAKLQSVALDSNSLTSNTLLKILFEEYWQNFPEYVPYTPPVENGLQIADAAISIGDSTFFMKDDSYMSIDLGEIWQTHTDKPFIYATWVTRKGLDPAEIAEPFLEAKKMGMEHLRQLAVVCGQQRDLPPDFIFKYFTKNIIFDVGKRELKGMELFFKKAELIV